MWDLTKVIYIKDSTGFSLLHTIMSHDSFVMYDVDTLLCLSIQVPRILVLGEGDYIAVTHFPVLLYANANPSTPFLVLEAS
jgi:hypothetical protein